MGSTARTQRSEIAIVYIPSLPFDFGLTHTSKVVKLYDRIVAESNQPSAAAPLNPDAITFGCVLASLERLGDDGRIAEVQSAMQQAGVVVARKQNGAVVRRNKVRGRPIKINI